METQSYATKIAPAATLFVGIDFGTSGCRAIAINKAKQVIAQSHIQYSADAQQTPELWWQSCKTLIHDIKHATSSYHIQSIAINGTSGTVLLCDENGKPLSPMLLYDDSRASKQAEKLKRIAPENSIVTMPSSGLAKVLWLLEHYPPQQIFRIVHQADWIAGHLCQRFDFSDTNNALKTGYDPVHHRWPEWMNGLPFDHSALPTIYEPGSRICVIDSHRAAKLELPLDVDIIAGTTDSTAAVMATGASQPGDAVTSLGSTLVLKVISTTPVDIPEHGIYSQPFGKYWLVGGASNSGGAVLSYFFSDNKMKELTEQINPEKQTNLHYYPLLQPGERFPINDPNHVPKLEPKTKNDVIFFQGLLEGIADIEAKGYRLLEEYNVPYPTSVRTTGGGAINKKWQAIRLARLGVRMLDADFSDAAYGTALLAAKNYSK